MPMQHWKINRKLDLLTSMRVAERIKVEAHECYWNAIQTILELDDFARATYVEGWLCCPTPLAHGWVERGGRIIDPSTANVLKRLSMKKPDRDTTHAKYFPYLKVKGREAMIKYFEPPHEEKVRFKEREKARVFQVAFKACWG